MEVEIWYFRRKSILNKIMDDFRLDAFNKFSQSTQNYFYRKFIFALFGINNNIRHKSGGVYFNL